MNIVKDLDNCVEEVLRIHGGGLQFEGCSWFQEVTMSKTKLELLLYFAVSKGYYKREREYFEEKFKSIQENWQKVEV